MADMRFEVAGRTFNCQVVLRILKFNPYHEPAGTPIGGQFASGPGGAGGRATAPAAAPTAAGPTFAASTEGGQQILMMSHEERIGRTSLRARAGTSKETLESVRKVLKDEARKDLNCVDVVELSPAEGRAFKAGGRQYSEGGHWDRIFGKIVLYRCDRPGDPKWVHAMLDHEIGHAIYERRAGLGRFQAAYAKHDGVTSYSKAWAKEGPVGATETFAELRGIAMGSTKASGKIHPDLQAAFDDLWKGKGH